MHEKIGWSFIDGRQFDGTAGRSYYHEGATWETSERDTTFGFNYGWTVGAEFETSADNIVRTQWQTWRSMDSDVLFNKDFSMNYLSLTLRKAF